MKCVLCLDGFSSESDTIVVSSVLDFVSQDEMLTPLGRLDKYISSENVFNRQMVARSLLDTLRAVSEDERECVSVLERIDRLADDSEPTVRAELMEQIPHIAIFCQENRPSIPFAFSKFLLPIVVRYLSDQNNLVRKTSQAALLVLLEQELMERGDVESLVCPVLVDLTAPDSSDDVKTEAMAVRVCAAAGLSSINLSGQLPRFFQLCSDNVWGVRKVCAANFGDVCSVVGGEATEELLLPRFFQLCSDNVWGVRKACAECFMTVSSASSPDVRRSKLSSLFISLISDPSRWVRQAAFQSLGPFISTFASPSSNTAQCFRDEAEAERSGSQTHSSNTAQCFRDEAGAERSGSQTHSSNTAQCFRDEAEAERSGSQTHSTNTDAVCPPRGSREEEEGGGEQTVEKCLPEETQPSSHPPAQEIPEQELFNSFHYWRTPIPQIQLELLQEEDRRPSAPALGRTQLQELIENLEPHTDDPDVKAQVDVLTAALRATALDSGLEDAFLEPRAARSNPFSSQQPSEHLSADTQRRDSSLHVTHDDDDSDVSDSSLSAEDQRKSKQQVSWKVRRTLAFSIHELALILGDQLTAAHLVPIFNSFLKDLDEVRIGVLKHLYDFLKIALSASGCVLQVSEIIRKLSSCSSLLVSFLGELVEKFCHSLKWSGRQAFAFICQLSIEEECLSLDQFSEHLLPPLLQLASDPVANVRVLLAKTLRQTLLEREYFLSALNCQQVALEHTLVSLQTDVDKDVKYFSSVHPGSTRLNEDAMSSTSSTY
ncbi:serine/threonine-protein phosphatase 4 regulatory subunit 1-like [Sinocyclocheilus grahami]|uniref:serine/threonine-protein phosphatase 4 regulatory subunit 1-like n=2 Tax=Sinocyclocheilus TaxID=75365 RepID=UPI0007ACB638|nr:PREDICTED: serine/threonine-protein phosphatase 4 regulatory subunit 1-like [Sinocyclocheilus grahami]